MMLATMSPAKPVQEASSFRMNVRGASSTFEVAEEPPSMPVRQASRRRVTAAIPDFSRSRAQRKPPSMPVRQLSKPRDMGKNMRTANTYKDSQLSPIRPERQESIRKLISTTTMLPLPMTQVAELSVVKAQVAELQKPCYYFS